MSPKGRSAGRRAHGAQAGDAKSSGRHGNAKRAKHAKTKRAPGDPGGLGESAGRRGPGGRDSVTHKKQRSGRRGKSAILRYAGEATDAALRSSSPRSTRAEATVTLTNKYGLHMRPAGEVVKMANSFPCDIKLVRLTTGGVEGRDIQRSGRRGPEGRDNQRSGRRGPEGRDIQRSGRRGVEADAKSVLDLIALEAHGGDEVLIQAKGQGAREAVAELADLLARLPEFDKELNV